MCFQFPVLYIRIRFWLIYIVKIYIRKFLGDEFYIDVLISTFVLINLWLYLIHLLEKKCLNPIFRIYLLLTAVKNKHKSDKICIIIRLISLQKYLQCMQMPARTPWHLQRKFCKHSWQTRVEAKWWPKCSGVQGPYPQGGIHLDSPRTILGPGESRWLCMCKHQDSVVYV